MLNASGRRNEVSLPLASLAHQFFVQTCSARWGTADDCNAMNLYLIGRGKLQNLTDCSKPSASSAWIDEASITNLLIGIHAAAAVEVLRFAKRLGLDRAVVREVVKDAAGSSVMFGKVCAQVQGKPGVSLKSIDNFESISQNLVSLPYIQVLSAGFGHVVDDEDRDRLSRRPNLPVIPSSSLRQLYNNSTAHDSAVYREDVVLLHARRWQHRGWEDYLESQQE